MPQKFCRRSPWIWLLVWISTANLVYAAALPLPASRPSCLARVANQTKSGRALRKWLALTTLLLLPPVSSARAGFINPGQDPKRNLTVEITPLNGLDGPLPENRVLPEENRPPGPESRYRIRRYVDHFYQPKKDSTVKATPQTNPAFGSFKVDALGGERDVQVTLTTPAGEGESEIVPKEKTTDLEHRQRANGAAQSLIVWDGQDGAAPISYAGLGGDNFRRDLVDSFIVAVTAASQPGKLTLRVYDAADPTGKVFSTATIQFLKTVVRPAPQNENIPAVKLHDQVYRIYFDNFVAGPNGPADFSNVGAVSLTVEHGNRDEGKVEIDFIALAGPPKECPIEWGGLTYVAGFGPPVQWDNYLLGEQGGYGIGGSGFNSGLGFITFAGPGLLLPPPPMPAFPPVTERFPGYPPTDFPPGGYCPPPIVTVPTVPEPGTFTLTLIAIATAGAYRAVRIFWAKSP